MAGYGISLLQASTGGGVTRAGIAIGGGAGSGAPGGALLDLIEAQQARRAAASPGTGRGESELRASETGLSRRAGKRAEQSARAAERFLARAEEYRGALDRLGVGRGQTVLLTAATGGNAITIIAREVSGLTIGTGPAAPTDAAADPPSDGATEAAVGEDATADLPGAGDAPDAAEPPVIIPPPPPADASTGAAGTALTILAGVVEDVSTGAGDDAVSISAGIIERLSTGDGDDAVAIAGGLVQQVSGGDGDDALAVLAGIAGGISGGDGRDAITVVAGLGESQTGWDLDEALARLTDLTASDAATRFRALLSNIADVDGGAGDDAISVAGGLGVSVAGGTGDDAITVAGRSVGLHYGLGDGHDTVAIAPGTDVLLQLGARPDGGGAIESYTVTRSGDTLRLDFGEGSITFTGVSAGGLIAVQGREEEGPLILSTPAPLDLTV